MSALNLEFWLPLPDELWFRKNQLFKTLSATFRYVVDDDDDIDDDIDEPFDELSLLENHDLSFVDPLGFVAIVVVENVPESPKDVFEMESKFEMR